MQSDTLTLRTEIVDCCRKMNALGINQGTSGNISARVDNGILITPSAVAYDAMQADDIVFLDSDGVREPRADDKVPSSEWRFHLSILNTRPEFGAVIHTHSVHATALAICKMEIPAVHYMIAAAGASVIRCADYATYGTAELEKARSRRSQAPTPVCWPTTACSPPARIWPRRCGWPPRSRCSPGSTFWRCRRASRTCSPTMKSPG